MTVRAPLPARRWRPRRHRHRVQPGRPTGHPAARRGDRPDLSRRRCRGRRRGDRPNTFPESGLIHRSRHLCDRDAGDPGPHGMLHRAAVRRPPAGVLRRDSVRLRRAGIPVAPGRRSTGQATDVTVRYTAANRSVVVTVTSDLDTAGRPGRPAGPHRRPHQPRRRGPDARARAAEHLHLRGRAPEGRRLPPRRQGRLCTSPSSTRPSTSGPASATSPRPARAPGHARAHPGSRPQADRHPDHRTWTARARQPLPGRHPRHLGHPAHARGRQRRELRVRGAPRPGRRGHLPRSRWCSTGSPPGPPTVTVSAGRQR